MSGDRAVEPADDVEAARGLLLTDGVRDPPVVDDGRVVGVISRRDVARGAEL